MNRLRNTRKPGCSRTDAATACMPSKGWPTRGNKVRFPRMAGNGFLRPLYNKFRNTQDFGYRAIRFLRRSGVCYIVPVSLGQSGGIRRAQALTERSPEG